MATRSPSKNRIIYLLSCMFLLLAAVFLLPQAGVLLDGLRLIRTADPLPVGLALCSLFMTYIFASVTLTCIALKPIGFYPALVVQLASGFASKLVPAGIGGFALNARFLTRQRHSGIQAASVMALNGVLGFIGHLLILLAGFLFASSSAQQALVLRMPAIVWWLIASLALVTYLLLNSVPRMKSRLYKAYKETIRSARHMVGRPLGLAAGFAGALGVTAFFTLALYLCALSLGLELRLLEVLLVYTACAVGTAIVPTPGGLGGAEAALSASLIALGHDPALAVSVAVLYRLVVFWLPILPGFLFFQLALRRKII